MSLNETLKEKHQQAHRSDLQPAGWLRGHTPPWPLTGLALSDPRPWPSNWALEGKRLGIGVEGRKRPAQMWAEIHVFLGILGANVARALSLSLSHTHTHIHTLTLTNSYTQHTPESSALSPRATWLWTHVPLGRPRWFEPLVYPGGNEGQGPAQRHTFQPPTWIPFRGPGPLLWAQMGKF